MAEALLDEASRLNPGPGVDHSRNAALASKMMARAYPQMDETFAYVVGLLHNMGRRLLLRRERL